MKKVILLLLAIITVAFTFTSCEEKNSDIDVSFGLIEENNKFSDADFRDAFINKIGATNMSGYAVVRGQTSKDAVKKALDAVNEDFKKKYNLTQATSGWGINCHIGCSMFGDEDVKYYYSYGK